jgi:ABC-type transport system involved in cytochrome c biogenesis permease subunit
MNIVELYLDIYLITSLVCIAQLFVRNQVIISTTKTMFLACVVFHLISIILLGVQSHQLPLISLPQAINMMVFFASLIVIPLVLRQATYILGVFFIPVATFTIAFTLPFAGVNSGTVFHSYQYWYPIHTLSVIAGEALLGVAAIVSIVYLLHERLIRKGKIHRLGSILPPLRILDKVLYNALTFGFIAITIGMIAGALWATSLNLALAHIAPKVIAGAITWLIFAISIHQRFAIGWRGRRTAIITLIGFSCIIVLLIVICCLFPGSHGTGLLL